MDIIRASSIEAKEMIGDGLIIARSIMKDFSIVDNSDLIKRCMNKPIGALDRAGNPLIASELNKGTIGDHIQLMINILQGDIKAGSDDPILALIIRFLISLKVRLTGCVA